MRLLLGPLVALLLVGGLLPAPTLQAQGDRICFPDVPGITNCIEGRFREFWVQNGGLPVFGYPITPAATEQTAEGSFLTQYFERNRFELHPEKARPYDVLLGRLGDARLKQQGRDWFSFPKGQQQPGCLWFAETGHSVCDQENGVGFKSYWESHGLQDPSLNRFQRSLALFGLPLSEPAPERNVAGDLVETQWFERARFEWHPDKPREFKVLLGLLGNEVTMNLVANGDFETPDVGEAFATAHAGQNLGGWIVADGSVDVSGPRWQAASGKQSIDLTGEAPGTIYQDVPTVAGQSYRLRFAMAGNPDRPTVKRMSVGWGTSTLATLAFNAAGRSRQDMGWVYHEYTVIGEGTVTRLTFRSETEEQFFGPMVDNVSMRPVVR